MLLSKKPCIALLYELDGVCSLGNPEVPLRNTGVFSSLYILWNSILTIDSTCDAKSRSSFLARHNQYKCDLIKTSVTVANGLLFLYDSKSLLVLNIYLANWRESYRLPFLICFVSSVNHSVFFIHCSESTTAGS